MLSADTKLENLYAINEKARIRIYDNTFIDIRLPNGEGLATDSYTMAAKWLKRNTK